MSDIIKQNPGQLHVSVLTLEGQGQKCLYHYQMC